MLLAVISVSVGSSWAVRKALSIDLFISSIASALIPGWLPKTVGWAFDAVVFVIAVVGVVFVAALDALGLGLVVQFVSIGTDWDAVVSLGLESVPALALSGVGFE